MGSKHADPAITVRAPIEVQQAAKTVLRGHGIEMRDFVIAMLTALTKETDMVVKLATRHQPPPKPRGRPVGQRDIIYAFRRSGDPNAAWYGQPDLFPLGEYRTGEMDFQPANPHPFRGPLEIRYGPVSDEVPPSLYVYTTIGGRRMRPTADVHELLFGASTETF
ncbi:hypothetical protein [Actinocrispum sp. NPDC049592]|uniref:hypothetical protein n=1 Tax=Actinocrispum sp. NPDC049592 TaxID=3154835 RepID=UPI003417E59D